MTHNTLQKYLGIAALALGIGLGTHGYPQNQNYYPATRTELSGNNSPGTVTFHIRTVGDSVISGQTVAVYNNGTGQLIGSGILNQSYLQLTLTGINGDIKQNNNKKTEISGKDGILNIKQYKPAEITLYNIIGQEVLKQSTENPEIHINITGLANAPYIIQIKTENETEAKKIIKHGSTIYAVTKHSGQRTETETNLSNTEYRVEITGQGIYGRTLTVTDQEITDSNGTIRGYVVDIPIQEGITDSLFKKLVTIVNINKGANGLNHVGFKSIFQTKVENKEVIIRNQSPPYIWPPQTITFNKQQTMDSLITHGIYSHLKEEKNKLPISKITTVNFDPIIEEPGKIYIFPGITFGVTVKGNSQQGILNSYAEIIGEDIGDSLYTGSFYQEFISAYVAPNNLSSFEYPEFKYKTTLSSGARARKPTAMDIKLLQMGEKIPHGEQIEKFMKITTTQ